MAYDVRIHATIPDPPALRALLIEYFEDILPKVVAAGGPELDPEGLVDPFMADAHTYRAPEGCIVLAHDAEGRLVGCGTMKKFRPDAAEMKRLYVRPEARGTGLGKEIFALREAEARRLGVTTLYADTVRGNTDMLRIYEKQGFRYIPRYEGNANPAEYEPLLVYLEKRI